MRRLITEELSEMDKKFEDAIFSVVEENEQFKCFLCQGRYELEHEKPFEIIGQFKGKDINQPIHIFLCESCCIDSDLLEMEGY